jgi:hypothetical protein
MQRQVKDLILAKETGEAKIISRLALYNLLLFSIHKVRLCRNGLKKKNQNRFRLAKKGQNGTRARYCYNLQVLTNNLINRR